MKKFLNDNILYFICFSVYALLGAILLFNIEQGDLIFYASDNRTMFANTFFIYGTRLGEVAMYILLVCLFMFFQVRLAVAVGATGILTMIVSFVSKAFFMHDRPAAFLRKHDLFDRINIIDGVDLHSGATSFPSGHTMSAFALFSLLAFFLPRNRKFFGVLLFFVAVVVALSRIYLVQHFLKDIYLGAWMGLLLAILMYYVFDRYLPTGQKHWLNRPLFPYKVWIQNIRQKRPSA
ncbi:MAG: phosphatase PAP2 family protein [Bacteroidetes bacterium]|nr:phosphatase PAP2 family protein [Bacteroidota bacterium]